MLLKSIKASFKYVLVTLDLTKQSSPLIFKQNVDGSCMYKRIKDGKVVFLILLMTFYSLGMICRDTVIVQIWLAKYFDLKDMEEANYVLGIQLFRDK